MKVQQDLKEYYLLEALSQEIKECFDTNQQYYVQKIIDALAHYPDAPQPQNLLGIIAEMRNDNNLALKHYRAAWALAPYYRPSYKNIARVVDMKSHYYYFCDQDVETKENNKKTTKIQLLRSRLG